MFKVLVEGYEPTRGSKHSACVDLHASEDVVIGAGETKLVGLGVAIDKDKLDKAIYRELVHIVGIEDADHPSVEKDAFEDMWLNSHYLQLMLRSSLGKKGLILPNGVGIIDLDYEDEIKMIIHNPLTGVLFRNYDGGTQINNVRESYAIKKGNRIAQITLLEHKSYLFGIETEEKRVGGFGSTNKQSGL